jgi:diaminohydroxyphosphoribosylaminopyrimidine deaminase/5-amino-6-(5-phosphoribosylamino)uracil reductase
MLAPFGYFCRFPMMNLHETYMQRCLDLALLGAGSVAPNPMVGAVLVYENRIIGEGYHQVFGQAHAEVNCLNSVKQEDQPFISQSTLYVSLEPCSHFGKTPPCSMLIVKHGIPKVVIACQDPFPKVAGTGIEALKQAGVEVVVGVLEPEALALNKRFICFHQNKRPFIILKWAQTANRKIAGKGEERLMITNELTNRLVHRWRSEAAAILVGYRTALKDNPRLDNRYWQGNAPIRMVIDRDLSLPSHLHLMDGSQRTIVWNQVKNNAAPNLDHVLLDAHNDVLEQILTASYQMGIQSLFVEGGAALLQSFIDKALWDEARIISNEQLSIDTGLDAPVLKQAERFHTEQIQTDNIHFFHPSVQVQNSL